MINKTFIPFCVLIILLAGQAAYVEAVRPMIYRPQTCAQWWRAEDSRPLRDAYYQLLDSVDSVDTYHAENAQAARLTFARTAVPDCFVEMQQKIESWSLRRTALLEHFYTHPRWSIMLRPFQHSTDDLKSLWRDLCNLTKVCCQPANKDCVR
jgi:hypothetical protein